MEYGVRECCMPGTTMTARSKTYSNLVTHLSIIGHIPEADVATQRDPVPGGGRDGAGQHAAQGQGWRGDCGACLCPGHYPLSLLQQ